MPLHPQARQLLDLVAQAGLPPLNEVTPKVGRLQAAGLNQIIGAGPAVARVEDLVIPTHDGQIGARRYEPEQAEATIVWLHGGGFVVGDLDSHDAMCRVLANSSNCRVIAIDYRRAPEHPYPGPLEDCWEALEWVARGYPTGAIVLGGDSAGGNLTAVCTLRARDRGGPEIRLQVLVYPVTDFEAEDSESYRKYGSGPDTFLTAAEMEWFANHYIADVTARTSVEASPLRADTLAGLPPAIFVSAECDPLRDQGFAYLERLRADGVPVTHYHYEDQIHGFFAFVNLFESADEVVAKVGADIRNAAAAASAVEA
jgi:acetyl esterase